MFWNWSHLYTTELQIEIASKKKWKMINCPIIVLKKYFLGDVCEHGGGLVNYWRPALIDWLLFIFCQSQLLIVPLTNIYQINFIYISSISVTLLIISNNIYNHAYSVAYVASKMNYKHIICEYNVFYFGT